MAAIDLPRAVDGFLADEPADRQSDLNAALFLLEIAPVVDQHRATTFSRVAANAVASPHLLVRSGIGNEHVGRHLTLQPQLPVVAEFDDEIEAFRGIPQSYAVTEFEVEDHPEHGLWGYRIEGIMGTPGIVSTLLPFIGRDGMDAMRAYRRMAGSLLLVPDAASGTVTAGPGDRPLVTYGQRDDHRARLRAAARATARIYLAAGATRVIVPTTPPVIVRSERDLDAIDAIPFAPATAPGRVACGRDRGRCEGWNRARSRTTGNPCRFYTSGEGRRRHGRGATTPTGCRRAPRGSSGRSPARCRVLPVGGSSSAPRAPSAASRAATSSTAVSSWPGGAPRD